MTVVRRNTGTGRLENPVRVVPTGRSLPALPEIEQEMDRYVAILMGRIDPPVDNGILTLQECADAYHARAREIEGLIYRGERNGRIQKNHPYYKFRTGELQSYISLFRNSAELGSRRLSNEKWEAGK